MEPLDSNWLSSKTDIIDSENIGCRTPSPLSSCTGSDCSVSTTKIVATTKAVVEERNDAMLRLTSRLIPVANGPEEGSATESEHSILSSASTLKSRLHNLPPSSKSVELANRVTALNERIRRERDLYLHLQGLDNQIEENGEEELSTADSPKTVHSTSEQHNHGHIGNARARRRERLNSGSAVLQHQMSSDLQLCSSGFSSPEPLTLREIHEDWIEGMDQLPSPIKHQRCYRNENIAAGLSNSSIAREFEIADETTNSRRNTSQFSRRSYTERNSRPVSSESENLIASMVNPPAESHTKIPYFRFDNVDDLKDSLTNCELSSGGQKAHFRTMTSSTTSSTGLDYSYVTRKRIPMKFGGYRPSSELARRNLSSDSESDATPNRIMYRELRCRKYRQENMAVSKPDDAEEQELQHPADFITRRFTPSPDTIVEVEPFSVEKMAVLEDRPLSPVMSVDNRHFFDNSNFSEGMKPDSNLQVPQKSGGTPRLLNERRQLLDSDIGDLVKQNSLANVNADHHHNAQFMGGSVRDKFSEDKETYISELRTESKEDENSPQPAHHNSLPEKSQKDILPLSPLNLQSLYISNSSRKTETLILRKGVRPSSHGPEDIHPTISKPDTKALEITNHRSLPASVRSFPERMKNPENLRDRRQNHTYNLGANNVHPKIPPLEIHSYDPSQSHSLSPEDRGDETARSLLDVNALIQALSDVSLKQNASTDNRDLSMMELKSPSGCRHRFSGSSCPRSSEYTPGVGGSRQSLTSLEVSEAHSVRIPEVESTAPRGATPLLKSGEQSTRAASTTPERSESSSKLKKTPIAKSTPSEKPKLETDLSQESSFGPVVAKVNRTNSMCPNHPLKIKSTGKLISPKKYRATDIKEEIANPLTTRTDVSQSSDGSWKSFRSLKSTQHVTKVPRKKIHDLQQKPHSTRLPAPLSGRKVLEPLKAVPKIKPDLLTGMSQRLKRRKNIANDLSEIDNRQSEESSKRIMAAVPGENSTRRSPLFRTNETESRIACIPQDQENSVDQQNRSTINGSRISSAGRRTPRKSFDMKIRPSTEKDHKVMGNSVKGQEYLGVSSGRSYVTAQTSTENDNAYDPDDKLDNRQQHPVGRTKGKTMAHVINLNTPSIRLSNVTADAHMKSLKNCIHLNDLQDGREVTLSCGISECLEASLTKIELFNRLPDEISGSLTRRVSYGTPVVENLNPTNDTPCTMEDLRRNIQENNDRWIKGLMSDDDSENSVPQSAGDKVSSANSKKRNLISQSPNLLPNVTEIPQEIQNVDHGGCHIQKKIEDIEGSCSKGSTSDQTDPPRSDYELLVPLYKYRDTRRKSECNSQLGQFDSQGSSLIHSGTNSQQNNFRSVAKSTDFTTASAESNKSLEYGASGQDPDPEFTGRSAIDLCNFKEEQAVNASRKTVRLCDLQISSSTMEEKITPKDDSKAQVSGYLSDTTSNSDEHDKGTLNLSTGTRTNPKDDVEVEAAEVLLPKVAKFNSTLNRSLEHSQSTLNNIGKFDKDCEQIQGKNCHRESHFGNELKDGEPLMYPPKYSVTGFGLCEKISSPSGTKSTKSQTMTRHHQDMMMSSPVSIKSFLSMSKLNSSANSKWDGTVVPGANIVKKSQDRFPFTISESATRKTSKFNVVADVGLNQLMQNQNAYAERNDAFLTQDLAPAKSGDQGMMTTDAINDVKRIDSPEERPMSQLTPFLEEFTNKISDDSPENWDTQIPFNGSNYMSYGCRESPKALMPSVREMVKKISAKLGYTRRKRRLDPEETKVEILYRNKKCRYESGEGSSSAASLYQSQQLFETSNKLVPSSVQRSNDCSKAPSMKRMTPIKNHEHISMPMQHNSRTECDQNDLWIREFDSDVKFDSQAQYCRVQIDLKREIMPRTSSPVNDRYSMFMARSKSSGIINKTDHNERSKFISNFHDGGDNEKVNSNKMSGVDDKLLIEVPAEMVLKSPRTPANSFHDNTNELNIDVEDDNFEDSLAKGGCCCFKIYHSFVERGSKTRTRKKTSKKK